MATIRRGTLADLAAVQHLNQALFQYEHDQNFAANHPAIAFYHKCGFNDDVAFLEQPL